MPRLTPIQAAAALERLLKSGTITNDQITTALQTEVREIETRLKTLRAIAPAATTTAPRQPRKRTTKKPKQTRTTRTKPTTNDPARQERMQQQGRYLGLLMKLPKNQRAKYQAIAREKRNKAAIRALRG